MCRTNQQPRAMQKKAHQLHLSNTITKKLNYEIRRLDVMDIMIDDFGCEENVDSETFGHFREERKPDTLPHIHFLTLEMNYKR
uniref:Uncharacterized protein n=1 Tax=Romanomermis culicivorax TaxID=13658 RepID=A0A915IRT7_ROMCU